MFIEVEGPPPDVEDFLEALRRDAPPLAEIERVTSAAAEPTGDGGFTIVASDA